MSWDDDLHAGVTHLVAKGVGSEKYKAAVAAGMIVVKIEWLVESKKQGKIVPAEEYKLGILEGLCICTTGLYVEDREMVEQLCDEHHAIYQPDLSFGTTTHLLAEQVGGAKYDAAVAHGIPVVTLEWIAACVEAKAYVDEDRFRLQDDDNHEEESGPTSMKLNDELTQCIAQLRDEPRGDFLDGCVFWLSGFNPESIQKMKWLIRFGMGSRYDSYNSSVTHIIAEAAGNWRHLSDTNGNLEIVSPKWLIESCLAFECMQETLFPVIAVQPPQIKMVAKPSPQPMKRPSPPPNPVTPVIEAPIEKPTETRSEPRKLFSGFMVLFLRTWPVDQRPNGILKCKVENAGGRYREINTIDPRILQANEIKRITHIVVGHGVEMPEGMLLSLCESLPGAKVVTELWENHLFSRRSHDLFSISRSSTKSVFPQLPLPCFSISLYVNVERTVLSVLLELAGAKVTARLSKRNTHLLCCSPEGQKYVKAVEWKLHIVNSQWLVRSMIAGELEPIPSTLEVSSPIKRKRGSQDDPTEEEEAKQPQSIITSEATSFGPLTQLNNMLDAFDDQESCSIGMPPPRPKINIVHQVQLNENPNYFDDSQAQLPNSEMVGYAEQSHGGTYL
ncbi:hypothetical protein THRCLA_01745 [Thraustotheca clavata]|uniref:BRCT domain-containing protein n=1 Tax=Thraustotheca clavata TaxID=74557 RepID=A0A1W0A867_9STRA|nr:hypothetical protein THRCLA_01745 [Thraustotheca clavata]